MTTPVISHYQVAPILQARHQSQAAVVTSLDLGMTTAELRLFPNHVRLPDGQTLSWDVCHKIHSSINACYRILDGTAEAIQAYSELTGRFYGLMPTTRSPTLLVSGIPMHRIKESDPGRDTTSKIKAIAPVVGRVLDTATGLGYTAIEAARTAEQVVTIELDPTVLDIARWNPWSGGLFENPRIEQRIGDSCDGIASFESGWFSRIIHDPPTFSLAGELYSLAFYRQAFRVLRDRGGLFHYVGNPESKSGASVTRGVVRRLREAGFGRVVPRREAFGVVAWKS